MANISPSDRKIAITRPGESSYRIPGVPVVGITQSVRDSALDGEGGMEDSAELTWDGEGGSDDGNVGVPSNLRIESQKVRTAPDGTHVIDVVVSYDPAHGASSHEVRISKL